jgi:hypothetical protein
MTQRDLNRAVASATGENVSTIERMGFGPLTDNSGEFDLRMADRDDTDDSRQLASARYRRLSANV